MQNGSPLLFEPSAKGFSMICELLLENGADPLAENRTGISPLYIASRNGHKDVVKVLLRYGADCTRVCVAVSCMSFTVQCIYVCSDISSSVVPWYRMLMLPL